MRRDEKRARAAMERGRRYFPARTIVVSGDPGAARATALHVLTRAGYRLLEPADAPRVQLAYSSFWGDVVRDLFWVDAVRWLRGKPQGEARLTLDVATEGPTTTITVALRSGITGHPDAVRAAIDELLATFQHAGVLVDPGVPASSLEVP
ncbi:hypothetical protein [Cellulomonas palmilytica]|uniref:hypothetical protein n=1 Tax=Cellulomonas palmilytica TaxID=2608402 RepID=UPI001F3D851E|nr:hypothetical protein [Cellulomonas palmilytica]UJP39864.1 hypothetical protein F1D97_16525 [Cellulomonas palmilytica]